MTDANPGSARFARPALALFGGFLVALSLPPWGFWPLAFLGVVAFEIALGARPTRRQRAGYGFAFGVPWFFMGMGWMWFLTVPGYLVAAAMFAGLHAGAALVAPTGPWRTIGRPAAHTLVETVRLAVPFGGVPVATLGIAQAGGPLLGVARVGGVIVLTWIVFQVGFALAGPAPRAPGFVRSRRATRPGQPHGLVALLVAVVVIGLAAVAPAGSEVDAEPLTIAAVQGGGEQGTRAIDVPSSRVTRAHLDATATIEPDPGLDLVVWPENGIDVDDEPFEDSDAYAAILGEVDRLGVPVSVGVTLDSEFSKYPSDGSFVNEQVVIGTDGAVVSRYEKVRIVPFGEYVPLRGLLEALGAPLDQIPSDAVAGRDPAIIELADGTELGVMISWEVFFGGRGRDAGDGAILLNPTNGASYTGTILQTQQVASSKLRATETGRWVVQVSPTGFSAFVSPSGDVLQRTAVSERKVITMDVPLRDGTTWYGALGDWPWFFAALAVLGVALWFGELRERFGATNQAASRPA
ncbi:MAG: apolipoprotein N-acyltransferase [Ilumatobacter sp.]|uniref:apolipoprotein N-acyltransferase n=1 Tax=Ilumatobacter sp. TaxID=1967498 RepID=UPI00261D784D|nr:apolipoprotein N-acyltransferase [Ilumatobacter sp.]MDJ0770665.1 apolipoprotein N-acyltransferase [Ilumatobacter sp.]